MIIDRLAKLDKFQRTTAFVSAVVLIALVSYYLITRVSVTKLQAAKAAYDNIQSTHIEADNQSSLLSDLEERLEKIEKQVEEQKQKWFTREQAMQFFENINAMALAHNLKPISRIISEPKNLINDNNDKTKPLLQSLKTQSASVNVLGSYFDIIDFVNDLTLTKRRQKVSITNMHIALAPGENFHPRVEFNVVLLVDLSEEIEG